MFSKFFVKQAKQAIRLLNPMLHAGYAAPATAVEKCKQNKYIFSGGGGRIKTV
jgi:hypothetical protein